MQKFGDTCIMANHYNLMGAKLSNKGETDICVGNTGDHPLGKCCIMNTMAKKIVWQKMQLFWAHHVCVSVAVAVATAAAADDDDFVAVFVVVMMMIRFVWWFVC